MDVRKLRNHLILSGGGVEAHGEAREPRNDTAFDQASFGSAIRRLRLERAWTLRDLSERSRISQSALSRVETGQITLSFERAHALAKERSTRTSASSSSRWDLTRIRGPPSLTPRVGAA